MPTLASDARLRWLDEQLRSEGSVSIPDAAALLEVSEMTIRRDLVALEERGVARRVRGGATAVGPQTFAQRHAVAGRVAGLAAAGDLVLTMGIGDVHLECPLILTELNSSPNR